ncbi:MAG: helix-turn-helix transcriptional regulator [Raoultibacter sp.]
MDTALFYYTLIVLLVTILAAATCLSSYLVSHKRTFLFAFTGFLFYFFDVALVFQDDFVLQGPAYHADVFYFIGNPIASVVIGTGLLVSFWLLICDFLNEKRPAMLVVPGAAFALFSTIVLLVVPAGNWQVFLFYSMREAMLCWMLIFITIRYLGTTDEVTRIRLWRHRLLYALLWGLGFCVFFENVYFLLIFDPAWLEAGILPFYPERNFAENILVICCAVFAFYDSWRTLSLRFENPPTQGNEPQQMFINKNLIIYSNRHQLSARESEVLHLILLDKDNQNIATSMSLAVSTVKVHVHKILQKTNQPNRQELIRDFWKTS